jgi:hypothetical protein
MYLGPSRINFSVAELSRVDDGTRLSLEQLQAEYAGLLHTHATTGIGVPPIILASLTHNQIEAAKFLLANDFNQIGEVKVNCNSGNKITIYMKKNEPALSSNMAAQHSTWASNYYIHDPNYNKRAWVGGMNISCSANYIVNPALVDQGFFDGECQRPDQVAMYPNGTYLGWRPQCVYLLTTIPNSDTKTIELFEANQFFKVEEAVGYYPEADKVPFGLYMRYVNKEERKKFKCQTSFDQQGKTE